MKMIGRDDELIELKLFSNLLSSKPFWFRNLPAFIQKYLSVLRAAKEGNSLPSYAANKVGPRQGIIVSLKSVRLPEFHAGLGGVEVLFDAFPIEIFEHIFI